LSPLCANLEGADRVAHYPAKIMFLLQSSALKNAFDDGIQQRRIHLIPSLDSTALRMLPGRSPCAAGRGVAAVLAAPMAGRATTFSEMYGRTGAPGGLSGLARFSRMPSRFAFRKPGQSARSCRRHPTTAPALRQVLNVLFGIELFGIPCSFPRWRRTQQTASAHSSRGLFASSTSGNQEHLMRRAFLPVTRAPEWLRPGPS